MPYKVNAAKRQGAPRAKRRVTNWKAYDAALRQRGSLTVWFTEDAIAVSVAAVSDGPLSKDFDGLPASASRAL